MQRAVCQMISEGFSRSVCLLRNPLHQEGSTHTDAQTHSSPSGLIGSMSVHEQSAKGFSGDQLFQNCSGQCSDSKALRRGDSSHPEGQNFLFRDVGLRGGFDASFLLFICSLFKSGNRQNFPLAFSRDIIDVPKKNLRVYYQ